MILDPLPPGLEQLIERRKRLGQDGYDEVWEGVYHMAPMARWRHGYLQTQLTLMLESYAEAAGLVGTGPFNLGPSGENFRVPDLGYHRAADPEAVYLDTAAVVVEVVSPGDETYDKLPFYAAQAVEEVLVVDPEWRRLRILVLRQGRYEEADRSSVFGVERESLQAQVHWQ